MAGHSKYPPELFKKIRAKVLAGGAPKAVAAELGVGEQLVLTHTRDIRHVVHKVRRWAKLPRAIEAQINQLGGEGLGHAEISRRTGASMSSIVRLLGPTPPEKRARPIPHERRSRSGAVVQVPRVLSSDQEQKAAEAIARKVVPGAPKAPELPVSPTPGEWPFLEGLRSRGDRAERRAALLREAAEVFGFDNDLLRELAGRSASYNDLEREYLEYARKALG